MFVIRRAGGDLLPRHRAQILPGVRSPRAFSPSHFGSAQGTMVSCLQETAGYWSKTSSGSCVPELAPSQLVLFLERRTSPAPRSRLVELAWPAAFWFHLELLFHFSFLWGSVSCSRREGAVPGSGDLFPSAVL